MKLCTRSMVFILCLALLVSLFAACGSNNSNEASDTSQNAQQDTAATTGEADQPPVSFSIAFKDNPTYPYNPEWLPFVEGQKLCNVKVDVQAYPMSDYDSKVKVAISANSAPDVLLSINASVNPYSAFGLSGSLLAINKYQNLTPNFNALIEKYSLQEDLKNCLLSNGNLYYMPRISDKPIYNAGLLIRTDLIKKYGLNTPTTFDELHDVLKVFKDNDKSSYPLTIYTEPCYLFNFSMPSFGLSLGKGSDSGSYVLSYDYDKEEYFAGAISDRYKAYVTYFAKLYSEGLIDQEMTNASDSWTSKLATGKSMASYGWYDQIGGILANKSVEDMTFDMLPPLKGPVGASTVSAKRLDAGLAIPKSTEKRKDFESFMKAVDRFFFSDEMITLFAQGKEGVTFDTVDGKLKYKDEYVNDKNGLFKALQIKFGIGSYNTQLVWIKSNELLKKDSHYTDINNAVDQIPNGIPTSPPVPKFSDEESEEASLLIAPLSDMFEIWFDAFVTGKLSIDKDWDAYVAEAKAKNIDKLVDIYNNGLKK